MYSELGVKLGLVSRCDSSAAQAGLLNSFATSYAVLPHLFFRDGSAPRARRRDRSTPRSLSPVRARR